MGLEKDKKYFTTAISYVNGKPHLGHAYEAILTDTFTRYSKLFGYDSFMLTGVDEHGKKVYDVAIEKNMNPLEYCDSLIPDFTNLLKRSDVNNDHFFRTTSKLHKENVQSILQKLYDNGDIYKDNYEGSYCTPCETFVTEKDLVDDNKCPVCGRETTIIKEENYLFNMGKYADRYEEFLKNNDDFIFPKFRKNEVLGILKKGLTPLCISRKKEKMPWGIELPFDKDFVTYVWFDALTNYINGIGYLKDNEKFESYWKGAVHIIGKDILLHHCAYWPTMLMAMGLELPKNILIHGFWMGEGGKKMSKSLGNVIDPITIIDEFDSSSFRFYVLREMSIGHDGVFTKEFFINRHNNELANDFGNLINRASHMIVKNFDGLIPTPTKKTKHCDKFIEEFNTLLSGIEKKIEGFELNRALDDIMKMIRNTNKYMEDTAPWKLLKEDIDLCGSVLYNALESVRICSLLLSPVIPVKFEEIKEVFNNEFPTELLFGKLKSGSKINKAKSIFPKIEKPKIADVVKQKNEDNLIEFDDFKKVEIKTVKIIKAELVDDSDRLLYLDVDFGNKDIRKIVAGIAKFYSAEEVVGLSVLAVANLKPAKIRGLDSEGMLLTVKKGKKFVLVTVDSDLPIGKKLV